MTETSEEQTATQETPPRNSDTWPLVLVGFLVFANCFVYGRVLQHQFIDMDLHYYAGNPVIQQGLSLEGIRWAFTSIVASNWHPLTLLAHMTVTELFGKGPAAHHVANLLIHICSALLLFYLLRRMTGTVWRAGIVAILFSLHPLRVESVAWTGELKDVLGAFLGLVTLLAYLHFLEKRNVRRYLLICLSFSLALMTKASILTLPFALLLLDYWPLKRFRVTVPDLSARPFLVPLAEKVPLLALSAAMSIITLVTFSGSTLKVSEAMGLPYRVAMSLVAYRDYLWQTIYPLRLAPHYPYASPEIPYAQAAFSAIILLLLSLLVWRSRVSKPYLLMGWCWFFGVLVPVSGILPIGAHFKADRYTYFPHIGLFVAVVWLVTDLSANSRNRKVLASVLAAGFIAFLSTTTYIYVAKWRNNMTLFTHAESISPESALIQTGLASAYIVQGDEVRAEEHLRHALAIAPYNIHNQKRLAAVLFLTGRHVESKAIYERVIAQEPGHPENYALLALALIEIGDYDSALHFAREALKIDGEYKPALEIIQKHGADLPE